MKLVRFVTQKVNMFMAYLAWVLIRVMMPAIARRMAAQEGFSTASFMAVIGALIVVVLGMSVTENVLDAASAILGHADIADFPLVAVIAPFVPVVWIVGIMALAGSIGYVGLRVGRR